MECPNTMLLTSASDIKSWTARSPTASTPHSHALNRPHEDQPSPVGFILQPVSNPSTGCTSRRTVREQRAQGVQSLPPADEDVGTGVTTLSHLLRGTLRLPEGHPRQQRVHRQSDARCDPCVVSSKATTHTLSATGCVWRQLGQGSQDGSRRQVRECLCVPVRSGFARLCVNGWAVSVCVLRREPRGPHPEPFNRDVVASSWTCWCGSGHRAIHDDPSGVAVGAFAPPSRQCRLAAYRGLFDAFQRFSLLANDGFCTRFASVALSSSVSSVCHTVSCSATSLLSIERIRDCCRKEQPETVPIRCCDDPLILKGVDRHEKVGKGSLNPLCGGKICMDGVDMAMLDVEDAHHSAGHSDLFNAYSDEMIWGVVKIGSAEGMLEGRREAAGEQSVDDVRD
ncbi:hypothetical protein WA577_006710 [Blastocystis sp. JDR]